MINKEKRGAVRASKKLLSVILSAALVVSSCVPAFAAVEEVPVDVVAETSVEEVISTDAEEQVGATEITSVELEATEADFDAKAQNPKVTKVLAGSEEVGVDSYSVVIKNADGEEVSDCVDAGEYTVEVTAYGNKYAGTATTTYTINQKTIVSDDIDLTLGKETYTGEAIKPAVDTLTLKDSTVLAKDVDYEVTYGVNTEVGTGTVTITLKDTSNYRADAAFEFTFEIVDAPTSVEGWTYTVDDSQFVYTGSPITSDVIKAAITVKNPSKETATIDADYTVDITNADGTPCTEVTKAGDKFTVEIKVGDTTLTKDTYTVAKRDISSLVFKSAYDAVYKNEAYNPSLDDLVAGDSITGVLVDPSTKEEKEVITLSKKDITLGTLSGSAINAGDYTVSFTSKDANVTGNGKITFTIKPFELADDVQLYTLINDGVGCGYAGTTSVEPSVRVFFGATAGSAEVPSADFTIEYGENTKAGKEAGTLIIKPSSTNNLAHQKTIKFDIEKLASANVVVTNVKPLPFGSTLDDTALKKGGYFTVTDKSGNALAEDDYSFTAITASSANGGKATIAFDGDNVETGTKNDVAYKVDTVSLYTDKAYTSSYEASYINAEVKPTSNELGDVQYDDGAGVTQTLKQGDYEIVGYEQNKEIGTAYAQIKGLNEFSGTAKVAFKITEYDLTNAQKGSISGLADQAYFGDVGTAIDASGLTVKFDTAASAGTTVTMPAGSYEAKISELGTDSKDPSVKTITKVEITAVADKGFTNKFEITLATPVKLANLDLATTTVKTDSIPKQESYDAYTDDFMKKYVTVTTAGGQVVDPELYEITVNKQTSSDVTVGRTVTFEITPATGKDYVGGKTSGSFKISKTDFSNENNITVATTGLDDLTYDGTAKEAETITVTDSITKEAIESKNYAVTYKNNVDAGTATLVITANSDSADYTGTYEKTFEIKKATFEDNFKLTDPEADALQYTGEKIDLSDKVTVEKQDSKSSYVISTDDYTIKSVIASDVTSYDAGTEITVTATTKDSSKNYEVGTITKKFTIARKNISNAVVTLKKDTIALNSDEKVEVASVVVDGKTLKAADYSARVEGTTSQVTSKDNDTKVIVSGLGNYTGSVQVAYTVAGDDISKVADLDLGIPKGTLVYNGSDFVATVVGAGSLVEGTDFKVVYTRNGKEVKADDLADAGDYTATIQGIGNYSGTGKSVSYTIKPRTLTSADVETIKGSIDVTAIYKGDASSADISENGSTPDWLDVDSLELASFEEPTIENGEMQAGKVQLKTVANSNLSYDGLIDIDSAQWERGTLTAADFDVEEAYYDGIHAAEPAVTFAEKLGNMDNALIEQVIYQDNDHIGKSTAKAYISIKENPYFYSYVSDPVVFPVLGDISTAKADDIADVTYTGKAQTPEVKNVVFAGSTLVEGKDYTVTYENNTELGTAKAIITGIGNYGKTLVKTFNIVSSEEGLSIPKNQTKALKARNTNANSYILLVSGGTGTYKYTSSNKAIATVGTDGKITFKHKVGNATITVKDGEGRTLKVAVKVIPATPTVKVSAANNAFKVTASKVKDAGGYQVAYATKTDFSNQTKKAFNTTEKLSKTIKAKDKTSYYVKVRAYKKVNGKYVFGKWSEVKTVKTK